MIVYVDSENRIKAVGSTSDDSLTPLEITDGTFDGWSTAKICCYKVTVQDGIVTMMTPYVPSSELGYIDIIGKQLDKNAANIDYMAMEMDIDLEV